MRIDYHCKIDGIQSMMNCFLPLDKASQTFRQTWVYRGQKVDERFEGFCKLRTSLEKVFANNGRPLKDAPWVERGLLRKFKRQSESFLDHIPRQGDYMEWFALMQHYGAPTRLLDWTYSFFVALYFAVAQLENDQDGELWAVDSRYLERRAKRLFPQKARRRCLKEDPNAQVYGNFECMFMPREPKEFVCPMNPYKFNTRLTIQQGLFLCPGNITKSFADNLKAHFHSQKQLGDHLRVFKVERKARSEIMRVLHRMNISKASLFPGLDGFARSLEDIFVFPKLTRMFPADSPYVKKMVW